MSEKKQAVITFKAEGEMLAALNKISNKSEFIRAAVLNALDETCPFCGGAGFLNEKQRKHWKTFEDETYYLDANGWAVTGVQHIDGKQYVFDNDGCLIQ